MTASIKGPLIKRLKTFEAVADLADGRVFPNHIPQGQSNLPCVVVNMERKDRNQHLGGFDDSLVFDHLYLTAYAKDSDTAEQIGCGIVEELESIEGESITDAKGRVTRTVEATMLIDEEDDCLALGENSDQVVQFYRLEVQVQHSPGQPPPIIPEED